MLLLRGCKDDQERQELHNVVMVDQVAQAAALQEDDDLPDWMKKTGAPSWFGSENPDQARAFMNTLPKQST